MDPQPNEPLRTQNRVIPASILPPSFPSSSGRRKKKRKLAASSQSILYCMYQEAHTLMIHSRSKAESIYYIYNPKTDLVVHMCAGLRRWGDVDTSCTVWGQALRVCAPTHTCECGAFWRETRVGGSPEPTTVMHRGPRMRPTHGRSSLASSSVPRSARK